MDGKQPKASEALSPLSRKQRRFIKKTFETKSGLANIQKTEKKEEM